MNTTAQTAQVIQNIADNALEYALLLAAIGTIAMALIEVVKGVFSLRKKFHRRRVADWLGDADCLNELLLLAAGSPQSADVLYDQPTERMMGQIQAAANLALDFPDQYQRVYVFFTGPSVLNRDEYPFPNHEITEDEKSVMISITDNGVGREMAATLSNYQKHGTGTKNLSGILEIVNAKNIDKIVIKYLDGIFTEGAVVYGTKVIISIPKQFIYED